MNQAVTNISAVWKCHDTLNQYLYSDEIGVYLFILRRQKRIPPDRIIYVGTAVGSGGFGDRWSAHQKEFAHGGRTIWRPDASEDVYDLMIGNDIGYYEKLTLNGKCWLPKNKTEVGVYSSLCGNDDFLANWRSYVLEDYLPSLEVWSCALGNQIEAANVLETKLQQGIGRRHGIGYYRKASQNWLGRQEVRDLQELARWRFEFDVVPANIEWELD